MAKPRNKAVYYLEPCGLLDTGGRAAGYAGEEVQKVQPTGCPANGVMGQCYVQLLDGTFVGMVNQASLVRTGRTAPLRDRAAEARAERGLARRA